MANTIGKMFSVTSFGSSHGKAVGAVIDGCPANLELNTEDIQKELDKRKPGTSGVTTPRKEEDKVQILSHQLQELSITTTSIPKIIPCLKILPAHLMEIMAG